ncbi:DUF2782 domain-containing protein [Propionivibrio limicola]|uniref:DUF2782 domain-containing protein n=1 Tax=Propionivibrio limicola TaxID=167645 RepID=UPI001291B471|nr:DUF2782 domain-containing protein [Propionivibrio limicola]
MRRFLPFVFLLACAAAPVSAQVQTPAAPPAVPDARPPVVEVIDESVEPEVTIKRQDTDTIEEYRVNGRLYKIRIIPKNGVPYELVDQRGDGSFTILDGPGTSGLSIPMWVIGTF